MSLLETLTKFVEDELAAEGLTKEIIEYTDLDVAFSPVICIRGEGLRDAVEVSESTDPNKFLLRHRSVEKGWVTRDELRIMRARYLLARNGPPNPTPIATFDTATQEGRDAATDFMKALGNALHGKETA